MTARQNKTIYWLIHDRFDTRVDKSSWLEMGKRLQDLGWHLEIIAARSRPDAQDYGGIVRYVDSWNVPFLFRWLTMFGAYSYLVRRSRRGDFVLMNEDSLWLLPFIRLLGKRHIHLDIRTVPVVLPGFKRWLDRLLFWDATIRLFAKHADSHSFITEPLRQEFESQFGLGLTRYCVWQSGVNTSLFKPGPRCSRAAPTDAEFHLFYHGGLLLTRGIDLVLHAIARTEFPFRLRFTIVGDGIDRPALEAMSRDLGIGDRVVFKGFVPYETVVDLLNEADCCICPLPDIPEWRVSSPLKVLEYLACCKPMILTPLKAHVDVAKDIESVIWSRDFSADAIGEAIRSAWAQRDMDPGVLEAGRRFVEANFEWSVQAGKLHRHLLETAEAEERNQGTTVN